MVKTQALTELQIICVRKSSGTYTFIHEYVPLKQKVHALMWKPMPSLIRLFLSRVQFFEILL